MNSKMTTNSQLSTNEPKRKEKQQKQTKQTTTTGTESHGGISVGRRKEGMGAVQGRRKKKNATTSVFKWSKDF